MTNVFFIAFGLILPVFVFLGFKLVRRSMKDMSAQSEVLKSVSASELESLREVHKERSANGFLKIGAPIFTLVGGICLSAGIYSINRATESESWPMVEGEVIATDIVRSRSNDGGGTTYRAKIEYQYAIDGVTHYGNRVSYAGRVSSSNRGAAMEITARYRKGSKVAVYYDPEDHEECVLEPGMTAMVFLMPAIGGIFLVIGLALIFSLLKGRSKDLEVEPFE